MADTLNRKVENAESRSTAAIEQVGGEVSRLADAMEGRLNRIDNAGAQALEKLGSEIAKITERLTERIASAERRSAQAIDDVGDTVSRFSDRLQDKQERVSSELADRIRQSEERTARLLEDARQRIDSRLAESQRRAPDTIDGGPGQFGGPPYSTGGFPDPGFPAPAFPDAAYADSRLADPTVAPFGEPVFAPEATAAAPEPRYAVAATRFSGPPAPSEIPPPPVIAPSARFSEPDPFDAKPFDARPIDGEPAAAIPGRDRVDPDGFLMPEDPLEAALAASSAAPRALRFGDGDYDAAHVDDGDAANADDAIFAPPLSTKSVIEQARAAARASSEQAGSGRGRGRDKAPQGGGLFGGFSRADKKAKGRESAALRTGLMMTGAAAMAGVAMAGYELLLAKPGGQLPARVADGLGGKTVAAPGKPLSLEVGEPIVAMALSPKPIAPGGTLPGEAIPAAAGKIAAPSPDAAAFYADGARRIESHDASGVEALRKSANLGYAPAQFYLAKLYENGDVGLKKDPDEARRWTERAAEGGDKKAMHNLALYYFEGTGGAKNTTIAAQWFHRAADLGLVDSQYNLGRLYEEGFGVSQNPAEAYKWYLIAAKGGDAESRASAQRLKRQLSAEAQGAAERAAGTFIAQGPKAPGALAELTSGAGAAQIVNAQKALTRLGYYQGPADGQASPALKLAVAAYQRDQHQAPTGQVDGPLSQMFAAIAQ